MKKRHKLYGVWNNMKTRCYNKNNKDYERWGGRGITVCESWKNSFENFFAFAISNGWRPGLQIDRIDNDSGYYPENCRFVTPAVNNNNRVPTERVIETRSLNGKKSWKPVLCVETGEIFSSATTASRHLGLRCNAIAKGISRGHKCGGYHWKHI